MNQRLLMISGKIHRLSQTLRACSTLTKIGFLPLVLRESFRYGGSLPASSARASAVFFSLVLSRWMRGSALELAPASGSDSRSAQGHRGAEPKPRTTL
jgi:hypothetical protein